MPQHSFRDTVLEEFEEVSRLEFDSPLRLEEQLQRYSISYKQSLDSRPLWTAIIARKNSESVKKFQKIWANHVLRYLRRDQLSVRVAQEISGIWIHELKLNNTGSSMHDWPVVESRSSVVPKFEIVSSNEDLNLLNVRLSKLRKLLTGLENSNKQLEISIHESEENRKFTQQQLEKTLSSSSWKITSPLHYLKQKMKNIFR